MTTIEIDTRKVSESTRMMKKHSSPSDHTTVTTEVTDFTSKEDLDGSGRSAGRRRRTQKRRNKKANRDILMGLIAQEMTSSWKEEEGVAQGGLPEYSAADLFYAQMNGVQVNDSASTMPSGSIRNIEEEECTSFSDHASFANFDLDRALIEEQEEEERANPIPEDLSISRKSKASTGSSSESSADSLSTQEIQDIVWSQMPEEVKQKIPKEAWGRIFGSSAVDKTRKPDVKIQMEEEPEEECHQPQEAQNVDDDYDDISVISDITMHTSLRSAPYAPTEEDEARNAFYEQYEEELCPTLPSTAVSRDSACSRSISMDGTVSTASRHSSVQSRTSGVRFGNVKVRYYERILDVNPSVTSGMAIGIGWRYKRGGVLTVNEWENQKGSARPSSDLVMPKHVRESMLKDLGYTQKDFAIANRIILKAKHQRKVTVQNLGSQQFEETVEGAARRVMGLLSFGKKKGLV